MPCSSPPYYTIYRITHLESGKIYVGKHKTSNLEDGYMGSGKRLKRALEKYGPEAFSKEILFVFETEQEMNAKEAELVTKEFCLREDTFNICPGGKGGWGYVNEQVLSDRKTRSRITKAGGKGNRGVAKSKTHAAKMSETSKRLHASGELRSWIEVYSWLGKRHSPKTKRRMSEAKLGSRNNQYGTRWITDGSSSMKIKGTDSIPHGWRLGRVMKA